MPRPRPVPQRGAPLLRWNDRVTRNTGSDEAGLRASAGPRSFERGRGGDTWTP
jgi:hypothetical protein